MSFRDLVDSECGGSNSLVKFSTHFVQDHAFKDQGLSQSGPTESSEKPFLEASTEEVNKTLYKIRRTYSQFYNLSWQINFLVQQNPTRSKWMIY